MTVSATRDVFLNTPTTLKGKSQLEPEEAVHDRRIAAKRIHIKRVIGLAKTFKILHNALPSSKVILGSRINYVCFAIVNFRPCIVNHNSCDLVVKIVVCNHFMYFYPTYIILHH